MYKQIICDIDGVLCVNDKTIPYKNRKPRIRQIKALNNLKNKGNKIILFTSREGKYRKLTVEWLKDNGVKYNRLKMNKPKNDYIIDDKSVKEVTDI